MTAYEVRMSDWSSDVFSAVLAEVEVAVGVEVADEASGVALEVTLDLELEPERLVVGAVGIQPHAAEAAVPFQCGAVGDDTHLASHPHARLRVIGVVVIAVVTIRIAPDRLALQRADRDREGQRLGDRTGIGKG